IFRLYWATLNRLPDFAGFLGWSTQLAAGTPLATITTGFIASPEFESVYGSLDDTQFVNLLYDNVLNRAPDTPGLTGWVGQLTSNTMTREAVVNGFSESAEFAANTYYATLSFLTNAIEDGFAGQISRLYQAILNRAPDVAGFQGWVDQMQAGTPLVSIVQGFVGSVEFQTVYGSLADQA